MKVIKSKQFIEIVDRLNTYGLTADWINDIRLILELIEKLGSIDDCTYKYFDAVELSDGKKGLITDIIRPHNSQECLYFIDTYLNEHFGAAHEEKYKGSWQPYIKRKLDRDEKKEIVDKYINSIYHRIGEHRYFVSQYPNYGEDKYAEAFELYAEAIMRSV